MIKLSRAHAYLAVLVFIANQSFIFSGQAESERRECSGESESIRELVWHTELLPHLSLNESLSIFAARDSESSDYFMVEIEVHVAQHEKSKWKVHLSRTISPAVSAEEFCAAADLLDDTCAKAHSALR